MLPIFPPQTKPSDYAWVILTDHLFNETGDPEGVFKDIVDDESGTSGPQLAHSDLVAALDRHATDIGKQPPETTGIRTAVFKMYDDDGELYYSGRILFDLFDDSDGGEAEFAPLDDYGTPGAGCTEIRYFRAGKWVTL